VAFVNRQQPRDKVDCVALIDFPEYVIKRANNFGTGGVIILKACTAHILGEHVEASELNQGFGFIFL
jgi:hypothetical protein